MTIYGSHATLPMADQTHLDRAGGAYLWKTETQLNSPLSHLALYSWNLGLTDCKKGPMKGIFHEGPTMEPFCQKYRTAFTPPG